MKLKGLLHRQSRSNYRRLGLVGQGQFGQVYCAVHRQTGQLVALKNINRHRLPTSHFLRELRFLLTLEHPHIIGCHTLEQTETGRQLILDYCEGGTLRSILEQDVPLTLAEILTLTAELLDALEHAHSRNIIHCDIKPENILLTLTPDGWQAKVSDFGIARLAQEQQGQGSGGTGSPAYMAPERFYHQSTAASDLYAVGILLYELLLVDRPFMGNYSQLMIAHLNQSVTLPEKLPQAVRDVISKALQKLAARRFRSAAEMKRAIAALHQKLPPAELQQRFPQTAIPMPPSQFVPQTSVALKAAYADLALAVGDQAPHSLLLAATGTEVHGWTVPEVDSPISAHQGRQGWVFKQPVQQVCAISGNPIAVVNDTLYRLFPNQLPQVIATFSTPVRVVPGHRDRWMLIQSVTMPKHLWLLDTRDCLPPVPRSFNVDFPQASCPTLFLDRRHFVIANSINQATHLQLLTRWNKTLTSLTLNTPVHRLASSQEPYQVLAQAGTHQQDLLVINLKPLRVMRCRFGIQAQWLGELIVGYVGISNTGQLRMANFQGQLIGQVDGLPAPSAIAFHPPYHIWLATNQDHAPRLHHIDIRRLNLDIIF